MECWVHRAARAPVCLAVGREEAVADERTKLGHSSVSPAEVGGVRDRDVVVRLGADHEHPKAMKDSDREDGPVLAVAGEHERKGVVHPAICASRAEARRPGRNASPPSGGSLERNVSLDPPKRIACEWRLERDFDAGRVTPNAPSRAPQARISSRL